MIKIRAVIEHITYQNSENGYSILKGKVKDHNDLVTLVGTMLEVPVGSVLLCEGDWKIDRKYGKQFIVQSFEEVMPATVYGIEKYLGSGLVKGIGPKYDRKSYLDGRPEIRPTHRPSVRHRHHRSH